MTTKASRFVRWSPALPLLGLAGGIAFLACSPELTAGCPEGTVQTAGGGDVKTACTPRDQLAGKGGAAGEGAGQGGEGGGLAGQSGGPAGLCTATQTRCQQEKQETCGEDGQWGAAQECDVKCDAEGSKCVVAVQVATGLQFSCALLSDGTVRCWGNNQGGELGLGQAEVGRDVLKPAPVPTVVGIKKLTARGHNACALTQDGRLWCWGANDYEQIAEKSAFDGAFAAAPFLLPELGVADVGLGEWHLCVHDESVVRCRGANDEGQLGNPGAGPESGQMVAVQAMPDKPLAVAANIDSSCALVASGEVFCWGRFGDPADRSRPTKVGGNAVGVRSLSLSGYSACALRADGAVVCWGYNYYGQLGNGTAGVLGGEDGVSAAFVSNLSDVTDVSGSSQHSCATKGNGELWCWGPNGVGQLGNDCSALPCQQANDTNLFSPLPMLTPVSKVTTSAGGLEHTCAIADGAVYCWGDNRNGQLGNGEVGAGMNPTPTRVLWK